MQVTRTYYNAALDLLRVDNITLDLRPVQTNIINGKGIGTDVSAKRNIRTNPIHSHVGGVAAVRVINKIEIIGDFDSLETASGNYLNATWNRGDGTPIIMDMGDLPKYGETI